MRSSAQEVAYVYGKRRKVGKVFKGVVHLYTHIDMQFGGLIHVSGVPYAYMAILSEKIVIAYRYAYCRTLIVAYTYFAHVIRVCLTCFKKWI